MSHKYHIESLLRPPVEFYSAAACLMVMLLLLLGQETLLMPAHTADAVSILVGLWGFKRAPWKGFVVCATSVV